jgi:hypothetical protein
MPGSGVDTSIYGTLGANQPHPLALLGQFAAAQNQLNQNQLFQQTFRARQAMGPLMQQATDPQSGTVDWDKAAVLVATHPDTSFLAPEFLNNIAQKKLLDAQTTNAKLEATSKRMDMMAGIYSAAAKDPGVNGMSDMGSYMSQAMSIGAIDPAKYKETIAFLADPKYANLKGADFRNQVLLPHALAMQHGSSALTALNNNFDPALSYNPDGSTNAGWRNPYYGTARNINGTAGALSAGPTVGAAALNAGGPGAPAAPAAPSNPLQPTGPAAPPSNSLAPAMPTPPPLAQAQSGPQFGQMGPVRKAMLESVVPYQKDVDARQSAAQGLLVQMQQAQRLMKNFTPNGAASVRTELGRIASGMGAPQELQDELANGSIADSQAAQKLLFGIGSQLAAQLTHAGGGRMAATMWSHTLDQGSPNINMNADSISKIMAAMREVAHVMDMERSHLYGRLAQPNYDITRVRNDWANTLNSYIDAREGQAQ